MKMEVKAPDFRIGNVVYYKGIRVFLTADDFRQLEDDIEDKIIKPILLSDIILPNIGFKEIDEKLYCKRWRLNRVDIYKMISGNYPFYFRFNQVDLKIKYLHQLQNLYLALTGKELKIKL